MSPAQKVVDRLVAGCIAYVFWLVWVACTMGGGK